MKKLTVSIMKRKIYFLLNIVFIALFVSCGSGTNKVADVKLIPVNSGDLFQYIDTDGKIVITPQFTDATVFRNGLALVKILSEVSIWGYIKEDGRFAITPNYKRATVFSEDLAWVVSENGAPTAINEKGEEIVSLKNAVRVKTFKEGLSAFSILDYENWSLIDASPFKWGFVDKKGKVIINPQFSNVGNFSNGKCEVQDFVGKWGFIDKTGKIIIEQKFDYAGKFINGKAVVLLGNKFGVIDEKGKFIINPQFSYMIVDGNNYLIEKDKKWGWCDEVGNIIIKPIFEEAFPFLGQDLASIKLGDKRGYVNKKGTLVINPQFEVALSFNADIALVVVDKKVGFIDKTGKFRINPQFIDTSSDFARYVLNERSDYEHLDSDIDNEILNPKDIIRNPVVDIEIKKNFDTKSQDYVFIKRESNYIIKPKFNNVIYYYSPYTNSVEGYTYFTSKKIEVIKRELENYGVVFENNNNLYSDDEYYSGYAGDGYSNCYSVNIKIRGDLVVIDYGYECD